MPTRNRAKPVAKKAATAKAKAKGMPKAPRTPKQARDFYHEQATRPDHDWTRRCLELFRTAYGVPPKEARAIDAWNAPGPKHAFKSQDDIPFGAAVFSRRPNAGSDDAGHVFFVGGYNHETGERITRMNDIKAVGEVDAVPFSTVHDVWGHEILGWRDNVNGFSLGLGAAPNAKLVKEMRNRRNK